MLVVLLAAWSVSYFVLDVVVIDVVNLAMALAGLAVASWWVRTRKSGHAAAWFLAFFSIYEPFELVRDIGAEHRWPAGQMHELLIAQRISAVAALACLVMVGITVFRARRAAAATAVSREPAATGAGAG